MEAFNLLKFLSSFFQFVPWIKTVRYAIGIGVIGFTGLIVYRAFFLPTQKTINTIVAQSGAHVTVEQKKEEKPRFGIRPFIEGYGFAESDDRRGVGGKAGLRLDF